MGEAIDIARKNRLSLDGFWPSQSIVALKRNDQQQCNVLVCFSNPAIFEATKMIASVSQRKSRQIKNISE